MKKTFIIFLFLISVHLILTGQDCPDFINTVSDDFSYNNETEDFSLPFNETWEIILENQKAIMVSLSNSQREGGASVVKNRNGFTILNAHEIPEAINDQLFVKMGIEPTAKTYSKIYLKNLKAIQVEFNYKVYNLDDTFLMSGLMYMLIKGENTFVFMFTCPQNKKICYIPFFKSVMKNAFFGQEWY